MKATDNLKYVWNSLVVQWLRLCASTAGDAGSIPGQGTKIPHAGRHCQIKNKIKYVHKICGLLDGDKC